MVRTGVNALSKRQEPSHPYSRASSLALHTGTLPRTAGPTHTLITAVVQHLRISALIPMFLVMLLIRTSGVLPMLYRMVGMILGGRDLKVVREHALVLARLNGLWNSVVQSNQFPAKTCFQASTRHRKCRTVRRIAVKKSAATTLKNLEAEQGKFLRICLQSTGCLRVWGHSSLHPYFPSWTRTS